MRQKPQPPPVPRPASETIRQTVIDLLRDQPLSAKEISFLAHIPEKEVYGHLEHIRRTTQAEGDLLDLTPAVCRGCGFVFAKRDRFTPPGKCPVCRSETISAPRFSIRRKR